MPVILLTLTIFMVSACGLFDYSHNPAQRYPTPKKWEEHAKTECKKGEYEKNLDPSFEQANFQSCVDRKIRELEKEWQTKRPEYQKHLLKMGFNFGLVFGF